MNLVATLICHPADPALDCAIVEGARAIIAGRAGAMAVDGVAADIPFASSEDIAAIARVSARRAATCRSTSWCSRVDRRKKLFLADMDSTMIGQECIDELADYAGLKAHVAAITERAMRGEIAFEPALRERVTLLKGLPVGMVGEVLRPHHSDPGRARTGRDHARQRRLYCLVSGGFTLFTKPSPR